MKVLRAVRFREKQGGPVVVRGWGEGNWELIFERTLIQDEMSSGNWLHNNVNVLKNTEPDA